MYCDSQVSFQLFGIPYPLSSHDQQQTLKQYYGENKTIQIMMATVRHVTSSSGLRKFQPDGFLLVRVYI